MKRIVRLLFMVMVVVPCVFGIMGVSSSEMKVVPKSNAQSSGDDADYAGSDLLNIPLQWKPTDTISSLDPIDLTVFQNVSFIITPFNDMRKKPFELGKNIEKRGSDTIRYVTTKDNVAAWLTSRFARVLSEFDVDVVKSDGAYSLEADVVKFYVTEGALYKADVGLKIRLRSKSGNVIWEGLASASSSRWGGSYKAENYYESLSNATISVVHSLLKSSQFLQAVQKNK